jgi:lambda repressor-like predicted transcriptional regulator
VSDRCRCQPCTAANARAEATRRRAICYGRWAPVVAAEPVRIHLRLLAEAGIGLRHVGKLTGISYATLSRLVWGEPWRKRPPTRHVRADTAHRILAVQATTHRAAGAHIDATGTRRRLQALIALGWTAAELARQLGRTTASLRGTMARTRVTAATADQVRELYEQLSGTPPDESNPSASRGAERARNLAHQNGWPAPLAWDDIDTDPEPPHTADAHADIDDFDIEVAIERVTAGEPVQLTPQERNEVIHRLTHRGHSLEQIAGYLGICSRTVSRTRRASRVA